MTVYFKNVENFQTYLMAETESYTLTPEDINGAVSIFRIPGESALDISNIGDIVIGEGFLGVVSRLEPYAGMMEVTTRHITAIFDRETVNHGVGNSVEERMRDVLETEFQNGTDEMYARPYISVELTSGTAAEVEDGVYNVFEMLQKLFPTYGIAVTASLWKGGLRFKIGVPQEGRRNAVMNDGHHQLVTQDFGEETIAKVTTYLLDEEDETQVMEETNYYLMDNGYYYTKPDVGVRVRGRWVTFQDKDREKLEKRVADAFGNNLSGHQITFYSEREYPIHCPLMIRLENGRTILTRVTAITKGSSERRILYRAGTQKVTLTQKLKGVIK